MRRFQFFAVLLACLAASTAGAQGANEAVKIIVPFAAGGPADQIARIISTPLGLQLGKTVVVDNRGGAGGEIGAKVIPDRTDS